MSSPEAGSPSPVAGSAPSHDSILKRKAHARLAALAGAAALLLGALLVRLLYLNRAAWLLEGDDAVNALMGLDILAGSRPIVLAGQPYASAIEPYLMALSFQLFGISRVAARLPEMGFSLLLVGMTWLLARRLAGTRAAWIAAVLAVVPSVQVLMHVLKPWAPYTEVMVLGSLLLLAATEVAFPRNAAEKVSDTQTGPRDRVPRQVYWPEFGLFGRTPRPGARRRRWAIASGLAAGLAFYVHPVAIYYLPPVAVVWLARLRGRVLGDAVGWAAVGFAVGGSPLWLYNVLTSGATFRFFADGSGGQTADRRAVFDVWWNTDLPRAIGLWNPWGPNWVITQWLLALAYGGALGWALLNGRRARPRGGWRPLDVALLLILSVPLVFVFSGFGGPALNPWGFDATSRYAIHLWTPLVIVVGAALAALWQQRRVLALAWVMLLFSGNLLGILTTDTVAASQSPYWARLPPDNGALLAILRQQGITHVWANHWAGWPLMFDARAMGQSLVAADWYDVQAGGMDRFPADRRAVEGARLAGFLLVTDEVEPELVTRLRSLAVTFDTYRAPPYVLVVPRSRSVHPSEVTSALDYRY